MNGSFSINLMVCNNDNTSIELMADYSNSSVYLVDKKLLKYQESTPPKEGFAAFA